ncbi:MAG: ABC transporter ATP-binding protein, partial [Thermomicrobiales bacterium]
VQLRGQDVTQSNAADRNIGYVPQSFALYPHISVRDNIAYPLKLAGVDAVTAKPIVDHAAEMLRITEHLDKRPDQLSGGQKQRVAIARGIAKQSDIYVLDDPLAGLDFKLREQLVEDLRTLKQETRATFLYTTSDIVEAMTLADTLSVLDRGIIVEAGNPTGLYDAPSNMRTMALVGFPPANFLLGSIRNHNGQTLCETTLFEINVELTQPIDGQVVIGIRPERVRVTRGEGAGLGGVAVPARILLREDLGGEEIVYLESGGQTLTSVDRHTLGDHDLPNVTVHIHPADLALFEPRGGARVGRGAASEERQARNG